MNKPKLSKISSIMLVAMIGLSGCGGADDPDPTDIPAKIDITSADIAGSAVKGTLGFATVTVKQMNGSDIKVTSNSQTDAAGMVNLSIESQQGFGINGMFKMTVNTDANSTMICDAPSCAEHLIGDQISGTEIADLQLATLTYVDVPFASTSDGVADANFQVNALTTTATHLVEQGIANGLNVAVRELYELALSDNSRLVLKALGIDSKANVFKTQLISAESYDNFVVGQDCDSEGNCIDQLADINTIKLSLANAVFASISKDETVAGVINELISAINLANDGDVVALQPLRERMLKTIAGFPYLDKLVLSAEDVIDVALPFLESAASSGPVKEITNAENLATATITARNRISDNEAESKAFDGDTNTKWLDHNDWSGAPSEQDPSWIQVDFAEKHAVSSVFITSANDAESRDPQNFNIQGSVDGENWLTLAKFIGENFDERFQRREFRFDNGLEFYSYRLNITKNRGDDGLMQLSEIAFVGPINASIDHAEPIGSAVISASAGESYTLAFDNNDDTSWVSDVPSTEVPVSITVTLAQAAAVDKLVLISDAQNADGDPATFSLAASNDNGQTWVHLADYSDEKFERRGERLSFATNNTLAFSSYRLSITKTAADAELKIAEIALVGPKVADLNHALSADAIITVRNQIGDGEAGVKAFDGSVDSKWLDHNDWAGAPSAENPSWAMVQFTTTTAVNKLALTSANDADSRDPQNFNLAASNDGENWITLGAWLGENFEQRFQRRVFTFSNDLGFSFYRFNITKNRGDDTLMQIAEIELIGPQNASVDHSATASSVLAGTGEQEGVVESNATDDDKATIWTAATETMPVWLDVALPQAQIVTNIAITNGSDSNNKDPKNFTLQGSNDGGKTWLEIASFKDEEFEQLNQRRLFTIGNGFAFSLYRLSISANNGDAQQVHVSELELIGPQQPF
ncbi:discoidin domain-containing protein [Pseudoalteromonas rhizosphaerae]|uniref:discoidin domain-containing protein n=1 Tax=Pseudoalteromonas rhizosphaerae TaxID=2518973 RepID=UPI0012317993|nr:discoidin domain-containing protein [Pseudoalteromonas rhizosphaerae]